MRHTVAALAVLAALAALPTCAQSPPPTCRAPWQVETIHSLAALPAPIRNALIEKTRDIVDANQHFDATDAVMYGAHFTRFAFVWRARNRYVIVTEHGGIAYSNPLYTYEWTGMPAPPKLLNQHLTRGHDVCARASEALTATAANP